MFFIGLIILMTWVIPKLSLIRKTMASNKKQFNQLNQQQEKLLEEYNKSGLGLAEMFSLKGHYKTMGMIMSEPFKKLAWNERSYIYHVTVKTLVRYGSPDGTVADIPIEYIKKFKPWPYFHKPKPEKKVKESVAKPEQDVVK